MAVLLHVQGSGRDSLRPFGGHAIRTVAWDRFDPASVGQDVETIIISPPDAVTGLDAVTAIRNAGDNHPVLLVPDDSPGWRTVAATRLPGADVVLGGIRSLPDYIPSADYPHESGLWDDLERSDETRETARVIDLRRHIPRGGSRRLLRERMGDQPNDIAAAVREFTAGLTGAGPAEPPPDDHPAMAGEAAELWADPARATDHEDDSPWTRDPEPTPFYVELEPAELTYEAPAEPMAPPIPTADEPGLRPRSRSAVSDDTTTLTHADDGGPPPRRLARASSDPAILVPALLGAADRLRGLQQTAEELAEFVLGKVATDAVDVIVPDGAGWSTVHTAGAATGAGAATDVVDMVGLVTWLETFESPVVLDGSDLAAPGSWVLASPARAGGSTVALVMCWREPGRPVFDHASVTTLGSIAAEATPSLELALHVRQLARELSRHAR